MNKHNLLDRRYIVRLLALILTLPDNKTTNIQLAKKTGKKTSTIYPQLNYLEKNELIFKKRIVDSISNEKAYFLSKKINELFLKYIEEEKGIHSLRKYINNEIILATLAGIISAKSIHKIHKNLTKITLRNIFEETIKLFINKEYGVEELMTSFNFSNEGEKKDFKEFVNILRESSMLEPAIIKTLSDKDIVASFKTKIFHFTKTNEVTAKSEKAKAKA